MPLSYMRRASLQAGIRSGQKMNDEKMTYRPSSATIHPPSSSSHMPNLHISRRVQHALTGIVLLIVSYIIPPYPVGFALLLLATAAFYYIHVKRVHDESWDEWYIEKFGALLREHERGAWEDVKVVAESNDSTTLPNERNNNKQQNHATQIYNNGRRRRKTIPELPGAYYFLLGTTLSTLLFKVVVARTCLLILSIADPMAGVVGVWATGLGCNVTWKEFFQIIIRGKDDKENNRGAAGEGGPSIAGSVSCAICTILCTYVYIPPSNDIIVGNYTNSAIPAEAIGVSLSLNSRICIGIITAMTEAVAGRHLPVIGKIADDNLLIPLVVGSLTSWLNGDR